MISVLSWLWIVLLLVGQPLAAFSGRHRLAATLPPRMRLYLSSAFGIAVIGAITLILDLLGDRNALSSVAPGAPGTLAKWTLLTTLACAALWSAIQLARRMRWDVPGPGYLHLLPRTRAERFAFVGLALLAGLAEEFAFRGFSYQLLRAATGSALIAAVVTTLGFGLGHAYQGVVATIRTTLAGAILVIPVVLMGALLPSMVAHAALDILTGLGTLPLLADWGMLPPDGAVGVPGSVASS